MSLPGRPNGEYRSAEHEGTPVRRADPVPGATTTAAQPAGNRAGGSARVLRSALWRAAWKMKGRLLAAGLILGCAFAMVVGVYSAIASLFDSRDQWYRELAVADLDVRITPEDAINLPSLARAPGVAGFEQRLMLPGNIDTKAGGKLYALMLASEAAPSINRLRLQAGRTLDPNFPNEVVIERSMAEHHGYAIGDRFRLNVGNDHYELTVRGIAMSPEFLIDSANPNFFLPSKGSLGVVYVPYSLIEPRLGYRLVNSLLVALQPGADPVAAERQVVAALGKKVTVEESLPLARQFGHLYLELDLGAFRIFVPAIVLIFVATALVITVFLMVQWIAERKGEIGVMMALGYRGTAIARAFAAPALAIGAIAAASGIALSFVMLHGFGHDYAHALGLPTPMLSLRAGPLCAGIGGLLLVLVAATAWPLRAILRLTPRSALRGQVAGAQADAGPRSRATQRLARWPVAWRYALRSLLRQRGLALMSAAAVALSLGAALSYFVSLTSFEQSIVQRFAADEWDVAVDYLAPVWTDELAPLAASAGVQRAEPYLRGAVKLSHAGRVEPSLLLGLQPGSPARHLRIVAGRALREGDANAIVLERKTAAVLGLAVGDTVMVEARDQARAAMIVGLFSGVLPGEAYAPLADAQAWLDMADQATGAFLKTGAGFTQPEALYGLDRVGRVTRKGELVGEFVHHLTEIAAIVVLAFAFSLGVAVLFLFATTSYGVLRRLPEYATLRTLGFADATLLKMIAVETALVGSVGALLAAGVGVALSIGLNGMLSRAWFQIDTTVAMRDLLIVLLPALLLFPLTALPPFASIRRSGLLPTLRRRTFG